MTNPATIHLLIRLAYESVVDPQQWPVFLAEFSKAVNAHAAGLVSQDLENQAGGIAASFGFDRFWERRYAEYYGSINAWVAHGGAAGLQPGQVIAGESYIADAALMKTEFYADFLRPQGHFYSFGGTITREDSIASFFTAQRSKKAGPFGKAEHALARQLMPHFEAALRVHHRIARLEARLDLTSSGLDNLTECVLVTDSGGSVLFMNRQAERMLGLNGARGTDGLSIGKYGLTAQAPAEAARLRELMAHAAETVEGDELHAGGAMSVSRPDGRAPLRVFLAPLAAARAGAFSSSSLRRRPAVIVFVSVPENNVTPPAELLEHLWGLTPTEARLAAALVEGRTVSDFLDESGISDNTARTHLKRVFHKAGVTRQSELIRLAQTALNTSRHNESD